MGKKIVKQTEEVIAGAERENIAGDEKKYRNGSGSKRGRARSEMAR